VQEGEPQNFSIGTDWLRSEIQNRTPKLCWRLERDI